MSLDTKRIRWFNYSYLTALFIVTLITIVVHLRLNLQERVKHVCNQEDQHLDEQDLPNKTQIIMSEEELKPSKVSVAANDPDSSCDFFSGRWVYDNTSSPLYEESQCSFMKPDYACQKYGRKDLRYQFWKWKPRDCQLPRFDGMKFMEKIRGKRLAFVGDSLNRNQWTSLLCLIESSIHPSSNKTVVRNDNLFVFNATEYNATIEFYWSPLLVESNTDHPYNHSIKNEIIMRINSIEKHARVWNDADILIFDNFMWWVKAKMTFLYGSFGSPDAIHKEVEKSPLLYEMCLNTWADWLQINIDRNKTKLFFMSLSPYHYNGERWDGKTCFNETEPALKEDYWGVETDRNIMEKAEATMERLERNGLHVQYLNITHLSDYRKDAHTSINKKFLKPKSKAELANPKVFADCVHWCLPGVPDVWNAILYHYILTT